MSDPRFLYLMTCAAWMRIKAFNQSLFPHENRSHIIWFAAPPQNPLHDRTITVTHCGRICLGKRKINLSQSFAGQNVGIKEVSDSIWLVTFIHYDLGFFDHEACRLEPIENPFEPKVLPMSPV